MLPSELLRIKIYNNEYIKPLFAELKDENLFLADSLVKIYEESIGKRVKDLEERVKELELFAEEYGYDFKFFRGLKTLLDRRLVFEENVDTIDSIRIRAEIFETTNRLFGGFVLREEERKKVISEVSKKLNLNQEQVEEIFKSIYEEEKKIKGFEKISGEELLKLYNLSLLQTLLFRCKKLFLDVKATGYEIKRLLWNVKKLGLLYIAEKSFNGITFSIDGPVSVIKQIERYGTRMAKIIPLILPFSYWKIFAYISSKLRAKKGKSKIYKFVMSKESEKLFPKYEKLELEYDSDLEESFAKRFVTVTGEWKLIREPEPIISGKTIFIPDFLLIKDDIKVYLEIIGFWTEDYLKRKIEKIKQLKDINLILAIDYSLGDIKIDDPNIVIIKYDKTISSFDIIKALRKFEK